MVSAHPSPSSQSPLLRGQRGSTKGCILAFVVGVLVLGGIAWALTAGTYNGLVTHDEQVANQWSALGSMYQRRMELIPQLVAVVKGAADFEQSTLTEITDARARVGQLQMPEAPTDEQQLEEYMAAQQQLGSALSRLLVVSENYPTLQATSAFRDLQVQVEGTENRIGVSRLDYAEAVRDYNIAIRKFPANFVAGMYGFERKAQLEADDGSRQVPTIDFGADK